MRITRIAAAGLAAAGIAAGVLFGGVLSESGEPSRPAAAAPETAADRALQGFSLGDTQALVAQLQETLREAPEDVQALGLLGLAYQQRARETGDPAYYTKSEQALRRALALDADDLIATSGLGSLALSRHEFRLALELGRRAERLSPTTARTYGVIGDALVELGRYRQAFAAFDRMAALKPSLASYARVSYARELRGDVAGAVQAMELAVDAGRGSGEAEAWALVQLGKIHWSVGRLEEAAARYRRALAVRPGYVYALDALAQVEAARGNVRGAIRLERRAVEVIPLPQFVSQLQDLYDAAGEEQLAAEQGRLMEAIRKLFAANGVRTDLETAVYLADHGVRLREALELARRGRDARPSIDGDDGLAWVLARNGRCAEALPYSERALRLGTRDALKLFHRGYVEQCLGHDARATRFYREALELNSHFSLRWAPVAKAALA
jgi:tetratricopeptide (TPR) repeat protein